MLIDDLVLQPMQSSELTRPSVTDAVESKQTSSLLELSDTLGIRPDEGVVAFDHALRSGEPHPLASSIDRIEALGAARRCDGRGDDARRR